MSDSVESFCNNGGRMVHMRQGNRTVTIAYKRQDGEIHYGATIHRQARPGDTWNRKEHAQTAVARFNRNPAVIPDQNFPERVHAPGTKNERRIAAHHYRERYIREAVAVHGVDGRGPRNADQPSMFNSSVPTPE